MAKKILTSIALLALAAGAFAAPLSPEQAMQRAALSGPRKAASISSMKLAYTQTMADGAASAYLFTPESGQGFMLLSADDVAYPVLGYSDSGRIDPDNLPPALKWWLGEYEKAITAADGKSAAAAPSAPRAAAGMDAISPLLTTQWNQDAPYNNDCPTVGGVKAPSGCVAVSFAQVMNYFKYPEKGQGKISYTDGGSSRSMPFNRKIAWDKMIDNYQTQTYDDEQAAAVAWLMKACGFSVEMSYGRYMSGAQSHKLCNAAVEYFKYDPGIWYTERELYSTDEWTRMVYDNLKNVGPVIYDGSSIDGGHSFVCDGYDGNGYFHFNWGWGGVSDGYYVLEALNPESQGIGGAEGGFNYSQGIVLGMQKPLAEPAPYVYDRLQIYGELKASLSGNTVNFRLENGRINGWCNMFFREINVNVGAIITKLDGTKVMDLPGVMGYVDSSASFDDLNLTVGQYYQSSRYNPRLTLPGTLADGDYKIVLATRQIGIDDAPWLPMNTIYGMPNFCYLTVDGTSKTVRSADPAVLSFSGCVLDSPLYNGRNAKVVTTIKNDTELQLTACFSPVLIRDGAIQYEGDYMLATVEPGQTAEVPKIVKFFQREDATATGYGEYTLAILNRNSGVIVGRYDTYEMSSVGATLTVKLDDFSVDGAETENVVKGNRTFKDTYIVESDDFNLHLAYSVSQGYLDSGVKIIASQYNPDNNDFTVLDHDLYYDLPFLGRGESFDEMIPVDFSGRNLDAVYRLRVSYLSGGQNKNLGNLYIAFKNSAVEDLLQDADTEAVYYNLQGVRVDNPEKGQLLIRKAGGVTRKIEY